ncbi:MAG: trigger factor [bacterium]|nr:trigger factor [bacterium]
MSVQVEDLGKNMVKLTIEVPVEAVDSAMKSAYNQQKGKISIPGFRKGKVPQAMIEKMYGPEVFYEEAANIMLQLHYPAAVDECGVDIVSQPSIDIVQLEKGKPFIFTAEVAKKPEVTLGKYNGVTVTRIDTSVSDEEIDTEIKTQLENNARTVTVTDRAVVDGDTVKIDFDGSVDGVAFEGGKGEDYDLVIGSHSFIDTFEEQLIGKNIGDDVDVNVTFPEEYHAPELAGKPALFKVKVKAISAKEVPELNDEFVQDVSEADTVAEYREEVKKTLTDRKVKAAKGTQEDEAIQKIIDKSKMDIPEAMIDAQVERMINEFAQRIAMQGLSMEQYMQFTGATKEKLAEQVRPDAVKNIQSRLVLEQIVKEENIEVSDDELEKEIEQMAANYGMEAEQVKSYLGEAEMKSMKDDIAVNKAVEFIMANVKERAKAKSKTENADAE